MGSFSSKVRSIRYGGNRREAESNQEINSGIEDELHSTTDTSEMAENSSTQGEAEGTNEDEANAGGSTSHEQYVTPRRRQSFSWLVSSPVVLDTTANEQKRKGKEPKEGRITSSYVAKYTNWKNANSLQLSPEISPLKTERKPQCGASSSPSPSTDSNVKYQKYHNYTTSKTPVSPSSGNAGDVFAPRVGFGVLQSEPFQPPSRYES